MAACAHCGALDAMPADEFGRVLEIKGRLAVAAGRALQLRGMDGALAHIFEDRAALLRVSGVYLVVALVMLAFATSQLTALAPTFERLPLQTAGEMVLASMMGPIVVLGLAISFAVALLVGRAHFRKTLRPLLVARLPEHAGLRFRCRVCGGDLPEARAADVCCAYCSSVNIVPSPLHEGHSAALAREAENLRTRVSNASVTTMSIARRMRWTLIVCCVLTVFLAYGAPVAFRLLLPMTGLQ